jgi:predicted transcriptional regulator
MGHYYFILKIMFDHVIKKSYHGKLALFLVFLTSMAMVEPLAFYSKEIKIPQSESLLRAEIQELINNSPGMYFRETIRTTNRTVGVIQYHLNYLMDEGKVVSFETNNYKGYFPSSLSRLDEKKKRALIMFRVPHKHEILEILLKEGNTTQQHLTESLHISDQSCSYHLKVLENLGIIGREQQGLGKVVYLDEEIELFLRQFL